MKMPNAIAALGANVSLTASTIQDVVASPTNARAAFVMGNDGITYEEVGAGVPVRTAINQPSDWLNPKNNMALYEVFVSLSGDALDGASSALDTWLSLSTERIWILAENASNRNNLSQLAVQVRQGSVVQAGPVNYTLIADTT
jgi:hypothetical protein